ncbi:E3 ubiquitin-protein ligase MPSR1-like [Impatiens glandulifera]|uniref:E3 ubiquitin-protein ligase MPSR1-like n=1 Tax=Impatiens glandulifera TaxID=253017 RepID=UPI001FB111D6|nr:E3 ubiquitin-protein ligase MPSR1-like [Impatiens glandulifera]
MESEAESPELSFLERLITSRNRDLSIFLPILLGLTNSSNFNQEQDEDEEEVEVDASQSDPDPSESASSARPRGRIILINPMTQGMVVIEGTFSRIDSLFRDLLVNKQGQPPASKSSIDAMLSVEICEEDRENGCMICLDDWEVGMKVKEMPCKHKFHGECIEKWLGIHGSCPVCRYKMPVENDDDGEKKLVDEEVDEDEGDDEQESGRRRSRRRREIWVNFSFNRDRRNDDSNSDSSLDRTDSSASSAASVDEMDE